MQLNEFKITNEQELAGWKASWDGVSAPPDAVIEYYVKVMYPAKLANMSKIEEIFNADKRVV